MIRILLLEDRATDAELVERELRRGNVAFEMVRVETESAFRSELAKAPPDVILADYHLPTFDGLEALDIANEQAPDVPFIFVSGSIGEERAVEALRRGATDYVVKDRLKRLPSAVERAVERSRLEAVRKQMQRQLDQADRISSLGRVAATMAHEFNNVLMGIQPFAELLERRYAEPRLQEIAKQIGRSVARGKSVTREILRFANDAELEREPVDLVAMIESIESELLALLEGRTLRVILPDEKLIIQGDAPALQQVLTNLVINAKDAIAVDGAVTITVTRASRDELLAIDAADRPGGSVIVSVSDNGSGMSPEVLQRIFEPMFTTKKKGNGIGLPLAHQVITRHGGQIIVKSVEGQGTTFYLVLPLSAPGAASATGRERSPSTR